MDIRFKSGDRVKVIYTDRSDRENGIVEGMRGVVLEDSACPFVHIDDRRNIDLFDQNQLEEVE